MVRNIEAALGGTAPQSTQSKFANQSKQEESKKLRAGGKVARVVEGIR
jgi:starvation-inducible outer membrane lipoprotein